MSRESSIEVMTAWLVGLLFTRLGEGFRPEVDVSRVRLRRN